MWQTDNNGNPFQTPDGKPPVWHGPVSTPDGKPAYWIGGQVLKKD